MTQSDSFKNLYKKMDATSKTRFHAARRLKLHAKLSTYTVVVLSLVLILVSLMQAYDLGINIKKKEVCSGQLIPDTVLSFSSVFAGANPSLN